MAASTHWLDIAQKVDHQRLHDSIQSARRSLEGPDWQALHTTFQNSPSDPHHWHRSALEAELAKPQTHAIYFHLRRSLWSWPECATVSRRAMTILHVVIELAREEAFPWYVAVAAEQVRRLARISTRQYIRAVEELQTLAITRSARPVQLATSNGIARFPGTIDISTAACGFAQWVVRYRHGVPHHKKRAGWWINYDLLCETGRVHRCFMVTPTTLSKVYRARNQRMGPVPENWYETQSQDAMTAMEEHMSLQGPMPPMGMRAPLWRPMTST